MRRGAALAAATGLLLAGCATQHDRVVLLPNADGQVGKIAILGQGQETVLDQPYATAGTDNRGGIETATLDGADVRKKYALELAALPPRPVSFNLYFIQDSDELTVQSHQRFPEIVAEIARHPAAELVVIGHTDRQGELAYNDQLSLARAATVRIQLMAQGFGSAHISVAGRGEREPAVPTADGVNEPRNRRVEINVR